MGYFSELDIEHNEMQHIGNEPQIHYKTDNVNINGTCLQGYISANYYDLVQLFGEPNEGDGYKIDAEWDIEFDDGTIATIYNYKNGFNYCGNGGMPMDDIKNWHVGGFTKQALINVQDLFKQYAHYL